MSRSALENNIREFRRILSRGSLLCACVKANAYGHGLVQAAQIFTGAGADWLSVNAVYEARILREAGITCPIYIMGYVPCAAIAEAVALDCRIVVYNTETIRAIGQIAAASGMTVKVHIKVETGTGRQGVMPEDLIAFARFIQTWPQIQIEGIATHFANIEDTTDHAYAKKQIERFNEAIRALCDAGIHVPMRHCANSAATILFPEYHLDMVRIGISSYGMWPSSETYVSYVRERHNNFTLEPAFTWKTRIAQIKTIPPGEYIGYGCTYKTSHATRLAILPVGYYDGYDRGIVNGYVLIRGKRAPLRGRVCMNIIMVEVTDIPDAQLEDEVVLIGRSHEEIISAEDFARWAGTINYEVTTRVNERIPRIVV
ncbi:MAG: alanine racemase [Desulfobacterota bacterium]|nr:alanine racemase [Thermodesulfobacteriota bacterium]